MEFQRPSSLLSASNQSQSEPTTDINAIPLPSVDKDCRNARFVHGRVSVGAYHEARAPGYHVLRDTVLISSGNNLATVERCRQSS